ncbi:SDR family oxidoreductase [Ramlibacter sp.]|uniref:SDR family oxidoreductase n=1 Tax=Ramlibacter sp. TaxID=1917967 RepID=UPI0039C94B7F
MGAGLAGSALLASAAQAQTGGAPAPAPVPAGEPVAGPRPALQDPRAAGARPPFPPQQQPWPGLAREMTPRPDHGETSYRGSGRLAGRKALITGGDSGIGRAAAIAFAREGADVAIGYLPQEEEDAREVMQIIRAAGRKAVALPGDIRDEAFCRQLVDAAVRGLGGLDILCNNAARQQAHASIAEISTEQFDWTLKTNLYAMFWITKAALPHLPAGASIINTASVVAYEPPEQLLDYASTKAAIVAFTKSLAKQLAPRGVRVNAVAPGPYWTPLQPSGGQLPDALPKFGADAPLGRPGQPAEIAPVYVLLASAESTFTTGSVLGSTGGRSGP